jgi:predicted transcriptional regulator
MAAQEPSEKASSDVRLRLVAEVVASYVSRNKVTPAELPGLLQTVHDTFATVAGQPTPQGGPPPRQKPAVPVQRSITHDYIVCLEDGKKLTMLKRYLRARYDLSPEDYRRKWGLPPDYPMVAPAYAERRSAFAKSIGLGRGVRRRGP